MSSSISGIYEIVNKVNGNRYVGQSHDIQVRWRKHRQKLRHGTHDNCHLQSAWNKYGEDSFEFNVLFRCFPIKMFMDMMEQHYMDMLKPEYNLSPTAGGSCLGVVRSQETKDKISKANMGRKLTPEQREKLSASIKATMTPERRALSGWRKGLGKIAAKKPHNATEHYARISEALKGRTVSQEHRDNISKANKGKPKSDEHRQKISAKLKEFWENKKQC